MVWRCCKFVLAVVVCAPFLLFPLRAQTAGQVAASPPNYTFQTSTRVVLTDVTVTDAKGNPVHGLPQSAFHIFDNKQPQRLASFEEHAGLPPAPLLPASEAGVYSNDYLRHLPPVLNIVVIDLADIDMAEQMYLNYELSKWLNEQQDLQPLAIYLRAGSGCFLLQNFTSDRKLLLSALHKAIPRFPPPSREYLTDYDMLQQIATALGRIPGRKNVLWFSGGSTSFLRPDATYAENDSSYRALYDQLDEERIAIYPIDARGLMVILKPEAILILGQQQMAMNDVAVATGGHAYYNNNGFKEITEHLLESDSSFYTLTYSPAGLKFDNKWHKIRVAVDGGKYRLSYRTGYFADGTPQSNQETAKARTQLLANGEKRVVVEPDTNPIIFEAVVLPASDPAVARLEKPSGALKPPPPKKGTAPYLLRYTVPLDDLTLKNVDGKSKLVFGVAVVVLNRYGTAVQHNAEQVTMTLTEAAVRRNPHLPIVLDLKINLARGDDYLMLGVWDPGTGRAGSIQVPVTVSKPQT